MGSGVGCTFQPPNVAIGISNEHPLVFTNTVRTLACPWGMPKGSFIKAAKHNGHPLMSTNRCARWPAERGMPKGSFIKAAKHNRQTPGQGCPHNRVVSQWRHPTNDGNLPMEMSTQWVVTQWRCPINNGTLPMENSTPQWQSPNGAVHPTGLPMEAPIQKNGALPMEVSKH